MKRFFYFFFGLVIFTSCESSHTKVTSGTDENGIKFINIGGIEYEKILVEGHDFYYRAFGTSHGIGSDLVHNPNCKKCINNNY